MPHFAVNTIAPWPCFLIPMVSAIVGRRLDRTVWKVCIREAVPRPRCTLFTIDGHCHIASIAHGVTISVAWRTLENWPRQLLLFAQIPWYQASWGQNGVYLGPKGPRWAPSWPREPCYPGNFKDLNDYHLWLFTTIILKIIVLITVYVQRSFKCIIPSTPPPPYMPSFWRWYTYWYLI